MPILLSDISAELNASLGLHDRKLTVTDRHFLCLAVVADNEEEKKDKKPKLKDDRMNQPDGVSCSVNVISRWICSICSAVFYFD